MTDRTGSALRRRADIQGLRAVAVAAVIATHVIGWPRGGFLGVDAFFVISGFVITGVLLHERDTRGRTSLRGFWARRARRILPLALLVLAVVVAASRWAYAPAKAAAIQVDALWSALFAANWHFARVGDDYFQVGGAPSPVQHFWSLGVEEQFYLVWPWLFLAAVSVAGARHALSTHRGRLVVAVVAGLIGGASLAWAAVQAPADATTAYYSSLTRAWEIAAGAALATIPRYAVRLPPAARAGLSWVGLTALLASFVLVGPDLGMPFPGAVPTVAATLVVLLAGVGAPAPAAVLLTNPISRYLGDISYGLYLWHFPVLVLAPVAVAVAAGWAEVGIVAMTLLLAAITYHLLERPVLDAPRVGRAGRHGPRRAWATWWASRRRGIAAAGGALVALVLGVGATATAAPQVFRPTASLAASAGNGAVPPPSGPASATTPPTASSPSRSVDDTMPKTVAPTPTSTTWSPTPLGTTGRAIQDGLRRALAASSWPADLNPTPSQWSTTKDPAKAPCVATQVDTPDACTFGNPGGPEIDVYGDSLGIPLLATVEAAYGKHYRVRGLTKLACAVNGVDADFGKDEWAIPCVDHRKAVIDYVRRTKPAVLIMVENYAWSLKLKSGAEGAAAGREWLRADQKFVDSVKDSVGHVVLIGPSMPGIAFLDCYRAGGSPSSCVTGIPDWWETTRNAERTIQDATFVDTTHWYCVEGRCPIFTATTGTVLKADYLHMTVQYARQLAPDLRYLLRYAGVLPPSSG